ncbi:hypothetical protein GCK32_015930 [Trichostrongylus colubriformis]|uniref:G protein-coupled receptor n=1 Tax=Trichostrongylus colubriformis TaxID=6319 RepID=A0AAN8IQ40_TRICO
MDVPWPQAVFMIATIVTLPLHFAILFHRRTVMKRKNLTLFHGVADVVSLINYTFVYSLPYSQIWTEFYIGNSQLVANYGFRSVYFSVFLRNIGIALMSLQRYIHICHSGAKIGKIISRAPIALFAVFQWGLGVTMVLPISQPPYDVIYEMKPKLEISLAPSLLAVAGLVVAFMIQFVYNGGTYILNDLGQTTILRAWRTLGPLVYCLLSCVHPWTCLAFNLEIRNGVMNMLHGCISKKRIRSTSLIAAIPIFSTRIQ